MKHKFTPEHVTMLAEDEVFVFGSNLAGTHGRGAARQALRFGARYGKGTGHVGQTYGIATKDRNLNVLKLPRIEVQVQRFLRYAKAHEHLVFLVTKIGCGLAGYKPSQIAPMFQSAPSNVILPKEFHHTPETPMNRQKGNEG